MALTSIDNRRTPPPVDDGGEAKEDAIVTPNEDLSLAPVYPLPTGSRSPDQEIVALFQQIHSLARAGLNDPESVLDNKSAILDVIEKLMVLLAKEERKARHDRFDAKMTKLVERIEKLLAAAQKTLEAGQKELDAISTKSGFQLGFAILAVLVIAAAIAAAIVTGGAAALVIGAALAALMPVIGMAAGELAARGDTKEKQELNEDAADLNAVATELEKLMETEGELSSEAKELLRKLLEILMKIFDKLNATRKKQAEGITA